MFHSTPLKVGDPLTALQLFDNEQNYIFHCLEYLYQLICSIFSLLLIFDCKTRPLVMLTNNVKTTVHMIDLRFELHTVVD